MADSSHTIAAANREAIRAMRSDPKLLYFATIHDPAYERRFQAFLQSPAVSAHLRNCPYREFESKGLQLLADAEAYLSYGEADRVRALYATQLQAHANALAALTPEYQAVHRAVFALAARSGLPIIASLRYVAIVVGSLTDLALTPSTARRALRRLAELHLIDYDPGARTPGHSRSGQVSLDLSAADPDAAVDQSIIDALALPTWTELELQDYRNQAKQPTTPKPWPGKPRPPKPAKRPPNTSKQREAARQVGLGNRKHGLYTKANAPTTYLIRSLVDHMDTCSDTTLHDPSECGVPHEPDLVPDWFDLKVMVPAVIAEIGRRPGPEYRLAKRDPSRPFGPGNVRWEVNPKTRKPSLPELLGYEHECVCPWEAKIDCPCIFGAIERSSEHEAPTRVCRNVGPVCAESAPSTADEPTMTMEPIVSRICAVCTNPNRTELERRILEGDSKRFIAQEIGVEVTAIHRHARNHLMPQVRSAMARSADLHLASFTDRLAALADDSAKVRLAADLNSNPKLLLQAVATEKAVLDTLLSRLGVDADEVVETIHDAHVLVDALVVVLDEPMAQALSKHLSENGEHDLAKGFTQLAARIASQQNEPKKGIAS